MNGLPNWHQPVYYYRQVRKMGLIEMTILLSIILTVGQFLIVWSVYFERRFEKVVCSFYYFCGLTWFNLAVIINKHTTYTG